jgi:hypothetical protein
MPKRASFTHLLGCLRPAQTKLGMSQRYLRFDAMTDEHFLSLSMMGHAPLKVCNRIQKLYNFCLKLYNHFVGKTQKLVYVNSNHESPSLNHFFSQTKNKKLPRARYFVKAP